MTPIQESCLCLAVIKNYLESGCRGLRGVDHSDAKWILHQHLLITVVSFLDEWGKIEGIGKRDENVGLVVKTCKILVQRIRKPWPGLHVLRNTLLAHPPRNKATGFLTMPDEVLGQGRAPTAYDEVLLLADCAVISIAILITHFESDYLAGQAQLRAAEIETYGIDSREEYRVEMKALIAQLRDEAGQLQPVVASVFAGSNHEMKGLYG